eukprot:1157166-Pelagomonas_calceolata.AAC.1
MRIWRVVGHLSRLQSRPPVSSPSSTPPPLFPLLGLLNWMAILVMANEVVIFKKLLFTLHAHPVHYAHELVKPRRAIKSNCNSYKSRGIQGCSILITQVRSLLRGKAQQANASGPHLRVLRGG